VEKTSWSSDMIKHTLVLKEVPVKDYVQCDLCGKKYSYDISLGADSRQFLGAQEFLHIEKHCGYGTIFADGDTIRVDICQHCFKKHIVDKMK
jgi:hypothetical protein